MVVCSLIEISKSPEVTQSLQVLDKSRDREESMIEQTMQGVNLLKDC